MLFCREATTRRSSEIPLFSPASRNLLHNHALKRAFSRLAAPHAPVVLGRTLARALASALAVASLSIATLAQETEKPQTQASPSPAAQTPPGQTAPDQAPTASTLPKPVALYNLLQRKSVVFPDIAYSDERLSAGQKFELAVDNSVSVNTIASAALGSAIG